jgi:hypothetical protein
MGRTQVGLVHEHQEPDQRLSQASQPDSGQQPERSNTNPTIGSSPLNVNRVSFVQNIRPPVTRYSGNVCTPVRRERFTYRNQIGGSPEHVLTRLQVLAPDVLVLLWAPIGVAGSDGPAEVGADTVQPTHE